MRKKKPVMRKSKPDAQVNLDAMRNLFLALNDWEDIDALFAKAVGTGVFGVSFLQKVFEIAGKDRIRHYIKQFQITNDKGVVTDYIVSVKMVDEVTGRPRPVYKRVSTFAIGDFLQATSYRVDMTELNAREILRLKRFAVEKFGDHVLGMLPDIRHLLDDIADDDDGLGMAVQ